MSDEKFTPGEWHMDLPEGIEIQKVVRDSSHRPIAEVLETDSPESVWANTHLIAAAPDMYRALRDLLEDSESAYIDKDKTDAAYEALAKAEGRTND